MCQLLLRKLCGNIHTSVVPSPASDVTSFLAPGVRVTGCAALQLGAAIMAGPGAGQEGEAGQAPGNAGWKEGASLLMALAHSAASIGACWPQCPPSTEPSTAAAVEARVPGAPATATTRASVCVVGAQAHAAQPTAHRRQTHARTSTPCARDK